jgi:hypothetical protein
MALPEGFNEFEFLQDLMRKWQNKIVREEFSDLGGEDWEPNINISEGALRHACTHKDSDTAEMMQMRNDLFYIIYGKAKRLQAPIYGIPVETYQESVKFKPQVELFFAQDDDAVPEDRTAIQAEINFRLVNETEKTILPTEAERLARLIKRELANTRPTYTFDKGKHVCTYYDSDRGYNLQIYSLTPEEGERVVRKILSIQDHPFEDDFFRFSTPKRNSVNNPSGTRLVYGKQRKKPRWRPTGKVSFRWASLKIHGQPRDVILVDTTGSFPDALVR